MRASYTLETIFKWAVVIILAIVALKAVFTVLGIAFFIGGFLLFKILPLVLLGWAVLKVVQWLTRNGEPGGDVV
jgi:hypothetical protein